jgi:hypothetical protein
MQEIKNKLTMNENERNERKCVQKRNVWFSGIVYI